MSLDFGLSGVEAAHEGKASCLVTEAASVSNLRAFDALASDARINSRLCLSGVGFALADERVQMSYKYRTVRVRGTDLIGTIARKHGSAPEIYETSKDANTSVVPVFFQATGEIRFFDRSMLEDVVTPAS